jgi:hypothetical protein
MKTKFYKLSLKLYLEIFYPKIEANAVVIPGTDPTLEHLWG